MAVYTNVDDNSLSLLLKNNYRIGDLISLTPIIQGIENSNFLLKTTQGQYILTLFEQRVPRADIPYFIDLMEHMVAKKLPCPQPIADNNNQILQEISERAAIIVSFVYGQSTNHATASHTYQVGSMLAKFHLAGQDFTMHRDNSTHLHYWKKMMDSLGTKANDMIADVNMFIKHEYEYLENQWSPLSDNNLKGACHADFFSDNVFFTDDTLSAFIDFYFACDDYYIYDLAITINAWCFDKTGKILNKELAKSMINGYQKIRPLSIEEIEHYSYFAKMAAFRIFMTRLYDWIFTPQDAIVKKHDPLAYYYIYHYHQQYDVLAISSE